MTLRSFFFGVLLTAITACSDGTAYCGEWHIGGADDPAPLTEMFGEPVARLDIHSTNRCQPSLALDDVSVVFDTPPVDDLGKSTRAIHPENLLLMELVDENGDGRLGAHDALLLSEGPVGVVPPGVTWDILLLIETGERAGSCIDRAVVLIE